MHVEFGRLSSECVCACAGASSCTTCLAGSYSTGIGLYLRVLSEAVQPVLWAVSYCLVLWAPTALLCSRWLTQTIFFTCTWRLEDLELCFFVLVSRSNNGLDRSNGVQRMWIWKVFRQVRCQQTLHRHVQNV